jgi:tetratricopeptide (TPR) repeat protein
MASSTGRGRVFGLVVVALMVAAPAYTQTVDRDLPAGNDVSAQVERGGALVTPPVLREGEGLAAPPIGGLIAYSLKAAQTRLFAFGAGDDWRRRDPELFTLGGMTRPEGLLVDRAGGDIILIGRAQDGDAALTLDDFVVALRARWIHGKWPVVSIDPVPGRALREGDLQTVRFEGGIQDTQFGADLLDADHRLKRMGFGMLPIGVPGLDSTFERGLARGRSNSAEAKQIASRLWFEPVQDRVIVRDDVVQLGPMVVSVYTEVLSAKLGGKEVDPKTYHDEDVDAFAKDMSRRFDDVARAHPSVARVRGLNRIVASVAGLEGIDEAPSLEYWLRQYVVRIVKTPLTVKILQHTEQVNNGSTVSKISVAGGVQLRALALGLQSGDVSSLRRAILISRPEPASVSWRLVIGEWVIPLSPGALPRSALGPILAQAAFFERQERWDDEIAVLSPALDLMRSDHAAQQYLVAVFDARGKAYAKKGDYDRAIEDFNEAVGLIPTYVDAFVNRCAAYALSGQHDRAIQDCTEAIRLNPHAAYAFNNRSYAYRQKGDYNRAIADADEAILLDPTLAGAFIDRGAAYRMKGRLERALQDYDQALRLDPNDAKAVSDRGLLRYEMRQFELAIQDFDESIRLAPNLANTYAARGNAYAMTRHYELAVEDYGRAIALNPHDAEILYNRGTVLRAMGEKRRAAADFAKARQLNPEIKPP